MTDISDQQLSAFLDGELAPEDHARVAEALIVDEALAQRLDRVMEADSLFRESLAAIDARPLPDSIEGMLAKAENSGLVDPKIAANDNKPWRAVAASVALVVAFAAGGLLSPFSSADNLASTTLASLTLDPDVAQRLEQQPSGQTILLDDGRQVEIRLTFAGNNDLACREFRIGTSVSATQAVACRTGEAQWDAVFAAKAKPFAEDQTGYQTASSEAELFGTAVSSLMASDSFDAEEERSLIERQWDLSL